MNQSKLNPNKHLSFEMTKQSYTCLVNYVNFNGRTDVLKCDKRFEIMQSLVNFGDDLKKL
jgi:hypothetical protein